MITLVEADPGFLEAVAMLLEIVGADVRLFGPKLAYDKFCRRNGGWLAEHTATCLLGVEQNPETIRVIAALHYVNLLFVRGVL